MIDSFYLWLNGSIELFFGDVHRHFGSSSFYVMQSRVIRMPAFALFAICTLIAPLCTNGQKHSCALSSGGGVSCWGRNSNGQIGDGTTTDRYQPVAVAGLSSGVAMVALGNVRLFSTAAQLLFV